MILEKNLLDVKMAFININLKRKALLYFHMSLTYVPSHLKGEPATSNQIIILNKITKSFLYSLVNQVFHLKCWKMSKFENLILELKTLTPK